MVVEEASINNIMGGIESTGGVRLHNHKRKLKQRFDIIKKLGQGTYGKVQLGINKETGQEVAIKTIKKSKIETEADLIRIRREIQIMSSVQHPNIIHIYEVFENREKMVLVMEYAAGGELYDYLSERKVLVEDEARRIFRQIATACYYCHKHKICHRDLKLENILLDDKCNAKIADFGLSNVFDDQRLLNTFCGSPLYASPEIVKGTPYHGPEVDCWSLGVLLYTLVYGAMPFDGSNFKRLVRQISQGDYFEPKSPSPASPLIKEMLTVNPRNRASVEKICTHWWVNEGYDDSCLDISEELANQTPVRLDLLLSLAPPPPQLESDKMVVAGEASDEPMKQDIVVPTRSQSVGSLMELGKPAERRIKDLIAEELKGSPKRKLETTVSTDQANILNDGKRKDKIVKENTVADISVHGNNHMIPNKEVLLENNSTQILSKEMEVEPCEEAILDPSLQGAACSEIMEEAKKIEKRSKIKRAVSTSGKMLEEINEHPSQENICHTVDKENIKSKKGNDMYAKENSEAKLPEESKTAVKKKVIKKKVLVDKNENKTEDSSANNHSNAQAETEQNVEEESTENEKHEETQSDTKITENMATEGKVDETASKPVERRRSRIFEQAEKFQNMISGNENKVAAPEKPKKITIPGVSVGGFRKEFERKASLVSTSPPKVKNSLTKKSTSLDKPDPKDISPEKDSEHRKTDTEEKTPVANNIMRQNNAVVQNTPVVQNSVIIQDNAKIQSLGGPNMSDPQNVYTPVSPPPIQDDEKRKQMLKTAVNIISSAISEGTRKSKSRPCMRKPPVPFGASGRSASGSIGMTSPLSPPPDMKRILKPPVGFVPSDATSNPNSSSKIEQIKYNPNEPEVENKTSNAEITLKSATLPRRKTTKAEIQLDYPKPKPATMEFKTEMAHRIEAPPKLPTQRSEVIVPVNSPPIVDFRASSVEPERLKVSAKERIIPISFENKVEDRKDSLQSPPSKPPMPRVFQSQRSTPQGQSLSRQSTMESDSEATVSGEPIRKSPREYIIPIAVEGGGYVTPRAGSLEPSDTFSSMNNSSRKTNSFGRSSRRMNSLFSDRDGSEDEMPFSTLHRHSSFGKDSDTEDSRRDMFHMHRLRSSRPRRAALEHNDSVSSGEDDDDDGFEIVTAENLFSTLLSRVRDLTQRINVDDTRPGFPSTRLLSHFGHETDFFNRHSLLDPRRSPFGRSYSREHSTNSTTTGGAPWRRSVSRDLASDIESVFSGSPSPAPSQSATLPRGDKKQTQEELNLSDLDLKKLKLTEEDALALSYLTPGLSRRIQKQLFSQLPPSEVRKLTRTLSMRADRKPDERNALDRRSVDRISSTLPKRYSTESTPYQYGSYQNLSNKPEEFTRGKSEDKMLSKDRHSEPITNLRNKSDYIDVTPTINEKSFLPVKSRNRDYSSKLENDFEANALNRPRSLRSMSLREQCSNYSNPRRESYSLRSPDSSYSESVSFKNDDSVSSCTKDDISTEYSSRLSSLYPNSSRSSSYSMYTPETSSLSKYLTPRINESDCKPKTDLKNNSTTSPRKISRFLRPDFYDPPKEERENGHIKENIYLKEKKEREMETQKVLKEIRDKRIKNRVNSRRERSATRDMAKNKENSLVLNSSTTNTENIKTNENKDNSDNSIACKSSENIINDKSGDTLSNSAKILDDLRPINSMVDVKRNNNLEIERNIAYGDANNIVKNMRNGIMESTELLKNISDNIQKLESNVKTNPDYVNIPGIPDYVNVPKGETVVNKERISKLVRPKSYPADSLTKLIEKSDARKQPSPEKQKKSPEKDSKSKISRLNKFSSKSKDEKDFAKEAKELSKQVKELSKTARELSRDTKELTRESRQLSIETKENMKESKDQLKSARDQLLKETKDLTEPKRLSKEVHTCQKEPKGTKKDIKHTPKELKQESQICITKENSNIKKQNYPETTSNKNKFLQTIEKKFEKLRAFSNSPVETNNDNKKTKDDKKSTVETAIRKLREHSLPKNNDHCSTESGLIKRAVSVEDFSTIGNNSTLLQPSRKSVTKILGLFKKYEDKDGKTVKVVKKKAKDSSLKKDGQSLSKETLSKVMKNEENDSRASTSKLKKNEENTVISTSKIDDKKENQNNGDIKVKENGFKKEKKMLAKSEETEGNNIYRNKEDKNLQRPKSTSGVKSLVKSDSLDEKPKSKLPVNYFRRSLNLDSTQTDATKNSKYPTTSNNNNREVDTISSVVDDNIKSIENYPKLDRSHLKLDLPSRTTDTIKHLNPATSGNHRGFHLCDNHYKQNSSRDNYVKDNHIKENDIAENHTLLRDSFRDNRNSVTTTGNSSTILSPGDDDSWSVCSDYHRDLSSPLSPNGHGFSGDEGESVIDRIRRKSFFTRFNEKKRPRKSNVIGNYKDLDLYNCKTSDYGSLDRRRYSAVPDTYKKETKPYARSSSLLNDGYVNVPNRYQTHNSRLSKRIGSMYSSDVEESDLDAAHSTEKSRKYSYYTPPSRLNSRCSSSPREENNDILPYSLHTCTTSPTSPSPVQLQ